MKTGLPEIWSPAHCVQAIFQSIICLKSGCFKCRNKNLPYPCFSKLVSLSNWGGFVFRWRYRLVAQPQGDLLLCIWGNLVKFQGARVASKFDVLPHWDAVFCEVCMPNTVANVPASNWIGGWSWPRFFEQVCFGLYWETSGNEKWVELGKWLCNRWR